MAEAALPRDLGKREVGAAQGIKADGAMLLMAGCGSMGLGLVDIACFYNVHYMMHHVAANSGSLVCDMADCVDWIGRGILHPEVMVTHVGELDGGSLHVESPFPAAPDPVPRGRV